MGSPGGNRGVSNRPINIEGLVLGYLLMLIPNLLSDPLVFNYSFLFLKILGVLGAPRGTPWGIQTVPCVQSDERLRAEDLEDRLRQPCRIAIGATHSTPGLQARLSPSIPLSIALYKHAFHHTVYSAGGEEDGLRQPCRY